MSDTKPKITDPSRILTVANMISLLRAFLALPIIYTLQYPQWRLWTFVLILIALVSDMLDGYFARRAHEVTHFGKWIDP
ncbi:CDP-alcohol phosphatidyltransferase family protein, partial [Marine Group I thaumarchaeote]|nr:CDP-alcohol phosphatidyltransferase family protein [Marine Group I thaumarchaeote]